MPEEKSVLTPENIDKLSQAASDSIATASDLLKTIRNFSGMTQKIFAQKYNIPQRTLEGWESGKRKPPEYVLTLLTQALMTDLQKASGNVMLKRIGFLENNSVEYWINPCDQLFIIDESKRSIVLDDLSGDEQARLEKSIQLFEKGHNKLMEIDGLLYEFFWNGIYTFYRRAFLIK